MIEAFDHTMLSLFRMCPAKFHYRMCLHLKLKADADEFKPGFGSCLHNALEAWYKSAGDSDAMDIAFMESWLPYEGQDPRGIRCMARGMKILLQYRKEYPITKEPFIVDPEMIEIGFAAELGPYILYGRCDGVVEYTMGYQGYVILEHKSSAAKGYLCTKPNYQADGYLFGPSQLLDKPITGILFNLIYHQAKAIEKNDFSRVLTTRSESDVEAYKADTLYWMNLINSCVEQNHWPKNPEQCGAFHRECEYKGLCNATNEAYKANLIELLYTKSEWKPYYEEESDDKQTKESKKN